MAAIDTTRGVYGSSSVMGRIFSFFGGIFGALEAWQEARLTRKVLSDLTDHELADIGLPRGQIELFVQDDRLR